MFFRRTAATAEGAGPSSAPTLAQRRTSLLSNFSDRLSYKSSSDNLRRAGAKKPSKSSSYDDSSYWTYLPVLAAIVPVLVGLEHEGGAAIASDLLILVVGAWVLRWFVSVPWQLYHAAQQRYYDYSGRDSTDFDDDVFEDSEDAIESAEEAPQSPAKGAVARFVKKQESARRALKRQELKALFACFVGPLLGATLLHVLRGQLVRTEGIVSDFNLIIFVMLAELPLLKQIIKLRNKKTLHLQRIVKADPQDVSTTQRLAQRVAELEARLGAVANSNAARQETQANNAVQAQLENIERSIRRYEKRATVQSMQTEARFSDLETRLRDVIAVSAVVARNGQRPGIISSTIGWITGTIASAYRTVWSIITYPIRVTSQATAYLESFFIKDGRYYRDKINGSDGVNSNKRGYSSGSSSRRHSTSRR